jgi:Zn-dependent alcohol dehydrogenase
MKTKAAIGYAAGKPLEVVTVDLEGRAFDLMHAGESIRSVVKF